MPKAYPIAEEKGGIYMRPKKRAGLEIVTGPLKPSYLEEGSSGLRAFGKERGKMG